MTECAEYTVVEDLGDGVEIRRYHKEVWASTGSTTQDGAFVKLLAYYSGANREEKRMPMTVPVISWTAPEGASMAFVLPPGMEEKDAPRPLAGDISISTVGKRTLATVTFTGYTGPEDYDRNLAILSNKLKERGIKPAKGPFLLQYDDPRTPPLERRNEIAFEIIV